MRLRTERREVHNEEFQNVYYLPDLVSIKNIEVGQNGGKIGTDKLTGRKPLGRPGLGGRTILE